MQLALERVDHRKGDLDPLARVGGRRSGRELPAAVQ
jgi:hypothetical protein